MLVLISAIKVFLKKFIWLNLISVLLKIEIYVQVLLIPNRTWGQHLNFIDKSKIFKFSESFLADGKRTDAAIETGVDQQWQLLSLIMILKQDN